MNRSSGKYVGIFIMLSLLLLCGCIGNRESERALAEAEKLLPAILILPCLFWLKWILLNCQKYRNAGEYFYILMLGLFMAELCRWTQVM